MVATATISREMQTKHTRSVHDIWSAPTRKIKIIRYWRPRTNADTSRMLIDIAFSTERLTHTDGGTLRNAKSQAHRNEIFELPKYLEWIVKWFYCPKTISADTCLDRNRIDDWHRSPRKKKKKRPPQFGLWCSTKTFILDLILHKSNKWSSAAYFKG